MFQVIGNDIISSRYLYLKTFCLRRNFIASLCQGIFMVPRVKEGKGEVSEWSGFLLSDHVCCFKDFWGSVPELPWDIIVL